MTAPEQLAGLEADVAREAYSGMSYTRALLHGRPRFTEDIDVTLGVPPDRLPVVRDACQALGLVPLPADVRAIFAIGMNGLRDDPPLDILAA